MASKSLTLSIHLLSERWITQRVVNPSTINPDSNLIVQKGSDHLPDDFIQFYSTVNGMQDFYPNEMDEEGFLFYPKEAVNAASAEFEHGSLRNNNRLFIFAEYMHKSWWYGDNVNSSEDYVIGIIPHENLFKPITNSLSEFIELYLKDSFKLYDYS